MNAHRLLTVAALAATAVATTAVAARAADAAANWKEQCVKCHGPDGAGKTAIGRKLHIKDFTDGSIQAGFTDDDALATILKGHKNASGKQIVPPFSGLTDDDAKALVGYVRGLKK
jgi:mono/diheme cytochrome c family protein